MTDIQKKIDKSIERLRAFEPEEGYYLCFSGGKDSQTIYHLAQLSGVKFDAHYNVTSVDPPELVRFIRKQYHDVIFDIPRYKDGTQITMWNLIERNYMPPTGVVRYCCSKLKESFGRERVTVTGVRWAESTRRKVNQDVAVIQRGGKTTRKKADEIGVDYRTNKSGGLILNDDNDESRRLVEQCYRTNKTLVNPIVDWEESDVWEFLNNVVKVEHCCLYDEGYTRIGCIGCPMGNLKRRENDFERYPKYKLAYMRAFQRMLDTRPKKDYADCWKTPEEVFDWWLYGNARPKQLEGQISIDDFLKESANNDND